MDTRPRPQTIAFLAVCLLLTLGGAYLSYVQIKAYLQYPAKPVHLALSDLAARPATSGSDWVALSGGSWDCPSLRVYPDGNSVNSELLYRADGAGAAVLVTYGENRSCAEVQPLAVEGVLTPMNAYRQNVTRESNPAVAALPDSALLYDLCTYCGPQNTLTGLAGGLVIAGFGLLFGFAAWRTGKRPVTEIS